MCLSQQQKTTKNRKKNRQLGEKTDGGCVKMGRGCKTGGGGGKTGGGGKAGVGLKTCGGCEGHQENIMPLNLT